MNFADIPATPPSYMLMSDVRQQASQCTMTPPMPIASSERSDLGIINVKVENIYVQYTGLNNDIPYVFLDLACEASLQQLTFIAPPGKSVWERFEGLAAKLSLPPIQSYRELLEKNGRYSFRYGARYVYAELQFSGYSTIISETISDSPL